MDRETIYFELGLIRGAASVAQRNIRDVILDAIEIIQCELDKEEEKEEEQTNRAVVDNLSKKINKRK